MQNEEAFWKGRARRFRCAVNAAWWLEAFAPRWTILTLGGAVLLLALRSAGWTVPVAGFLAVTMLFSAVWALFVSRKCFLGHEAALARLDWELGLYNQLTTAHAGLAPWPAHTVWRPTWRWDPTKLLPHLLSLVLLMAAAWVPVPEQKSARSVPFNPPAAWAQAGQMLEILHNSSVPDLQTVEELVRRLEDLRAQNPADWYRHSSLEAGEHLRESVRDGARALAETIARAAAIADAAREEGKGMTESSRARLEQSFEKMRQDMMAASIPPSAEWKDLLEGMSPDAVQGMSKGQWQELRKKMEEGLLTCAECLGQSGEELLTMNQRVEIGGVSRGPGEAPMLLKENETQNVKARPENLPFHEGSMLPGDVVKVTAGEHDVDRNWQGTVTAESAPIQAGGDAVWSQNVTLEETETIRRYFQ